MKYSHSHHIKIEYKNIFVNLKKINYDAISILLLLYYLFSLQWAPWLVNLKKNRNAVVDMCIDDENRYI